MMQNKINKDMKSQKLSAATQIHRIQLKKERNSVNIGYFVLGTNSSSQEK